MAATGNSLKSVSVKCSECKGKFWDPVQSKRQANVREKMGLPIPNDCADSQIDGPKCPYRP